MFQLDPSNPSIPDGYAAIAPTIYPAGSFCRDVWDKTSGRWKKTVDYSGRAVYEKGTGRQARRLEVGQELPNSLTFVMPPTIKNGETLQWNEAAQAWDAVP